MQPGCTRYSKSFGKDARRSSVNNWQRRPPRRMCIIGHENLLHRTVPGENRKVPRTGEWGCEFLSGKGWSKSLIPILKKHLLIKHYLARMPVEDVVWIIGKDARRRECVSSVMKISSATVPGEGSKVPRTGVWGCEFLSGNVWSDSMIAILKNICSSSIIWQGCPLKEPHVFIDEVMFLLPRTVPGENRKVPRTGEWDCEFLSGHGWSESIHFEQGENIRTVNM